MALSWERNINKGLNAVKAFNNEDNKPILLDGWELGKRKYDRFPHSAMMLTASESYQAP